MATCWTHFQKLESEARLHFLLNLKRCSKMVLVKAEMVEQDFLSLKLYFLANLSSFPITNI